MENIYLFTTDNAHSSIIKSLLIDGCNVQLVAEHSTKDGQVLLGLAYDSLKDLCRLFYRFGSLAYFYFEVFDE